MSEASEADSMDPLAHVRQRFHVPEGLVYLDGNSLGPLPHGVAERLQRVVREQWGDSLIRGWNDHAWVDLPVTVGDRVAGLIGAAPGTVVCGDTTSINVAKALAAGLQLRPDRRVVLSDSGNFPTDLYMAQGLLASLGADHELRVVAPEEVAGVMAGPDAADVAVMMLTHVDYRTGRMHDMAALTAAAHAAGAIAMWDLAHSAGAVPLDLAGLDVDLAVGCTYKYLNGGPGAPAFVHVNPRHADTVQPLLSGWFGHESPFAFDLDYRPVAGVQRMRVGTPPVLALSALDAALDVWEGVSMTDLRAKSVALCERFIAGVETRCAGHGLRLVSPRDADQRGSQVSFAHEQGYAIIQALISEGVIGDFRAPDVLRFGFTPLYLRHADVDHAVRTLGDILDERRWDTPAFMQKAAVT